MTLEHDRFPSTAVQRTIQVGLEWYEPLTRAACVNALLAALSAAGVHELVGVYDRHSQSPDSEKERAARSAWTTN